MTASFQPRSAEHSVSVNVYGLTLPVPFAEPGTTLLVSQVRAEWKRYGAQPWSLVLVTVRGVANNGHMTTVDYFPDNPTKQPPRELSAWIASTHPGRVNQEQRT